jgi:hypothetical protein
MPGQWFEKCHTLLTQLHLFNKQSEETKMLENFCIIKRYFAEGCFLNLLKVCVHMCICACVEVFTARNTSNPVNVQSVRTHGVELEDTYMKFYPHKMFFGAIP